MRLTSVKTVSRTLKADVATGETSIMDMYFDELKKFSGNENQKKK